MNDKLTKVKDRLQEEPVLVIMFVALVVNALALIGLEVSPEMLATLNAFLLPAIAFITRKVVAPVTGLEKMTVPQFLEAYGAGDDGEEKA
jgi:hypothetical protein